jgi:hypothetical protein
LVTRAAEGLSEHGVPSLVADRLELVRRQSDVSCAPVVETFLLEDELGGVVLAAAGGVCGRSWLRSSGPGVMGLLLGVYVAAFGGAHPLAKKIGAWPSVLAVTAVASGATYALADRSDARF